jgi:hypothetical protein
MIKKLKNGQDPKGCRAIEREREIPQIWPIKESRGCLPKMILSCGVNKATKNVSQIRESFKLFKFQYLSSFTRTALWS